MVFPSIRSLALIWLLSSAEIFATAKRIETSRSIPTKGGCLKDEGSSGAWKALVKGIPFWKKSSSQGECKAEAVTVVRGGHAPGGGGVATTIPLPLFKIFLQLLLTGLNVACWLVPMKIKRFRDNQELISLANAFSGGVFLSLAFGHMIPHSLGGFEAEGYPQNVPFLITLTGYLLIFFVEKIAFDTHSFMDEAHHHHQHHHPVDHKEPLLGVNGGAAAADAANGVAVNPLPPSAKPVAPSGRSASAVVLLLALAVHSIFETMALGLSDTPLQAGLLATSIALHQPAESIALLVAFLKSGMSQSQVTRYLTFFSLIGIVGVFLGLAVNTMASDIWDSVFVALAAGTFIYVGCTEIVAEEFEEQENKWKKFGALLAGVFIVGGITYLTEGWEGHAH